MTVRIVPGTGLLGRLTEGLEDQINAANEISLLEEKLDEASPGPVRRRFHSSVGLTAATFLRSSCS